MKTPLLWGALSLSAALAIGVWSGVARGGPPPASPASASTALSLADLGLMGPAGPDDEGQYDLIDPIGPGGASQTTAQDEVFAPTMIGGQYTKWRPYHDPFATGGGYGGTNAPEMTP